MRAVPTGVGTKSSLIGRSGTHRAPPDPPVQRMLSAYTRVRPDPITAAFVEAICHHTLATPTHLLSLLEPKRDR